MEEMQLQLPDATTSPHLALVRAKMIMWCQPRLHQPMLSIGWSASAASAVLHPLWVKLPLVVV